MNRFCVSIGVSLLGLATIGGTAYAQSDTASARKTIQAEYDRWFPNVTAAVANNDAARLTSFMEEQYAPEFKSVDSYGKRQNRKQRIEDYVKTLPSVKSVRRWIVRIQKVHLRGPKMAEVQTKYNISLNMSDSKEGKVHNVNWIGTDRDTWIRSSAGWKNNTEVGLRLRILRDGKPFNPNAAGTGKRK